MCKILLFGAGIYAPLILITFTNVGSNSQSFFSKNLSKSNSTLSAYDDAPMINIPQDKSNFSVNNPLMTYDKNIISILPLNQNQIEIQVDPIILDKLTSNSTSGNITSNPSRSPCTTIDGTSSNSRGINEKTPCIESLSNNNKEIIIDFDYQVTENDDTNSIDEYYNYLQLPNNLILQPGEIFVFSRNVVRIMTIWMFIWLIRTWEPAK